MDEYNEQRGLTIIECVILIAILGIMIAIILPGFSKARTANKCRTIIEAIEKGETIKKEDFQFLQENREIERVNNFFKYNSDSFKTEKYVLSEICPEPPIKDQHDIYRVTITFQADNALVEGMFYIKDPQEDLSYEFNPENGKTAFRIHECWTRNMTRLKDVTIENYLSEPIIEVIKNIELPE